MKEFLNQTFEMDKEIKKLEEQLEVLRHRQTSPTGGQLGLAVQKSRNLTATEDLTVKIIMLEERITRAKGRLLRLEEQIRQITLSLPSMQRAVLTWRYICRYIWADIAARAEMSEMQVMRAHNAALASFQEQKSPNTLRNFA